MDHSYQPDIAPPEALSSRGRPAIYPPPPQALFPAPQRSQTDHSSGTSSSGTKRKRGGADDGSHVARPKTRASSTSDFNNNTKAQVRERYNNKCWHCGASPADICHVIGSRDNTFQEALADGLVDFHEKQSLQNAIALCGTCHTNFDHVYNPAFFFLPTDIKYFLNYERQDQKRRRKIGRRTGTIPARICPTAQTYQDHQLNKGVPDAELGGIYTRIVIHDFLPQYPGRAPFQPGLSEYGGTKSWTGSPMASLQRAVLMLRKLNLSGIPHEIRDALRELQDAYSEVLDLGGGSSSDMSDESDIENAEGVLHEGLKGKEASHRHKRRHGPEGDEGNNLEIEPGDVEIRRLKDDIGDSGDIGDIGNTPSAGKVGERRGYVSDEAGTVQKQDMGAEMKHDNIDSPRFWKWGPGATSKDAAKFFQRVI